MRWIVIRGLQTTARYCGAGKRFERRDGLLQSKRLRFAISIRSTLFSSMNRKASCLFPARRSKGSEERILRAAPLPLSMKTVHGLAIGILGGEARSDCLCQRTI